MDSSFVFLVGSNCFLLGALLAVFLMFGMNKVTFHVQMVEPTRRKRIIKRMTGVKTDEIWQTIEAWHAAGWELVLREEHGVRIETIILQKFV